MSEEAKVKSFRVTDSVAEDIKRIAAEIGGNQQTAFVQMINAYEFQKSLTVPALSSKSETIEKHQRLISALSRMFLDLIEECQNQELTVGASYEAMLKSKDSRILELEEKFKDTEEASKEAVKQMKEVQKQAEDQEKSAAKTIKELQTKLDQAVKKCESESAAYEKQLQDKELLCTTLSESCANLKQKNAELSDAVSEKDALMQQVTSLIADRDEKDRELQSLHEQLASIEEDRMALLASAEKDCETRLTQQKSDLELEKARELLALEQKLREEQRKAMDDYQNRYTELMERYLSLAGTSRQSTEASTPQKDA